VIAFNAHVNPRSAASAFDRPSLSTNIFILVDYIKHLYYFQRFKNIELMFDVGRDARRASTLFTGFHSRGALIKVTITAILE
jgi:hypothetical protein